MRTRRAGWVLGLVAAALLTAGCAREPEISGLVSVDGKPAGKGWIAFIPADGKSQTAGAEIIDGKYAAKKVPVGTAKVEIRVPKVVGKRKLYDTKDSPYQDEMQEALPPKYNDNTELTFDVKPGKNEKDWDLSTKGK